MLSHGTENAYFDLTSYFTFLECAESISGQYQAEKSRKHPKLSFQLPTSAILEKNADCRIMRFLSA